MTDMPSIGLQRHKLDSLCQAQQLPITLSFPQEEESSAVSTHPLVSCCSSSQPVEKSPTNISTHSESLEGVQGHSPSDMSSNTNQILSQRHPIDQLTTEPVDITARSNGLLVPDNNSSNSSSDFGPFVSGFGDEFRTRSASFNSALLRGSNSQRVMRGQPTIAVEPTRRFSETQESVAKAGSADNVAGSCPTGNHPILHHSHTVPEIPLLALSNDSGYHTPPNRQQHTSPPWPPNSRHQWPIHVSPPQGAPLSQYAIGQEARPHLNQTLSIDVGHYQPEPHAPHIVIGQPTYQSVQAPFYHSSSVPSAYYQKQRSMASDTYSSPPSLPGSATPEEGQFCTFTNYISYLFDGVLN